MPCKAKTIKVDYLARVEGEGALNITVSGGEIKRLQLKIFEPPRFFQSLLLGRKYDEVPDLVARICGICPASHILASIQALEQALDITPSEETLRLRKLLALSQWIQSHALHTYMLALPDYFGYASVLEMLPEYKSVVEQALRLKRLGNDITAAVGGREVHPVTAIVGGFTEVPDKETVKDLLKRLRAARQDALDMVELTAAMKIPAFNRDCEFVALGCANEYAVIDGILKSSRGMEVNKEAYRDQIQEIQQPHSTALHSSIKGRGSFAVGPLARVNLNWERLAKEAKSAAENNGISFPSYNPFASIRARALEMVHSIQSSIEILESLKLKAEQIPIKLKAGTGVGVKEAPRGLLYHCYRLDSEGYVEEADIVSPTAHNVFNIENDLKEFVPGVLSLPDDEMTLKCEMLVRAYDPCISCSAHFLKLNIKNEA